MVSHSPCRKLEKDSEKIPTRPEIQEIDNANPNSTWNPRNHTAHQNSNKSRTSWIWISEFKPHTRNFKMYFSVVKVTNVNIGLWIFHVIITSKMV